jgi:DMSO/TMAO reductase YedYZ molybdopterin-dependent catalytic subunit
MILRRAMETGRRGYSRVQGLAAVVAAMALLSGCGSFAAPGPLAPTAQAPVTVEETPSPPAPTPTAAAAGLLDSCGLLPVVAPTPAPDPGYTKLDPTTGLHMTGKVQLLDLDSYRLKVQGLVDRPLALTYDQIRCLPRVEAAPDLICPGAFIDHGRWAGTPVAEILALAGVQEGGSEVQFVSADGYSKSLSLQTALEPANFLAYEWNGEPLPRLHGFPLRLVVPEAMGNQWVKWVVEINVR